MGTGVERRGGVAGRATKPSFACYFLVCTETAARMGRGGETSRWGHEHDASVRIVWCAASVVHGPYGVIWRVYPMGYQGYRHCLGAAPCVSHGRVTRSRSR